VLHAVALLAGESAAQQPPTPQRACCCHVIVANAGFRPNGKIFELDFSLCDPNSLGVGNLGVVAGGSVEGEAERRDSRRRRGVLGGQICDESQKIT
jgi:hypothetical protein